MCFHSKQSKKAQELKTRFKAKFPQEENYSPKSNLNGFEHPLTPVITSEAPDEIQMYQWGLIPYWAKDTSIQNNTLNAKIETLSEKASFKSIVTQRCLVLVDGFYEWQWHDSKGKNKEKYLMTLKDNEAFTFAGLWSRWTNPINQQIVNSYTIITTEADELMARIHNSKKRMPIILTEETEKLWLQGKSDIVINHNIIATSLEPRIDLFS